MHIAFTNAWFAASPSNLTFVALVSDLRNIRVSNIESPYKIRAVKTLENLQVRIVQIRTQQELSASRILDLFTNALLLQSDM